MSTVPTAVAESRVRRHREMLAVCGLVVALAFLLEVRPAERVAFRFLPGLPLPHTCPTRAWFHINCPGCGLSRGFIHLARGDWDAAWRCHRLSLVMAVAVLLQFPYRLIALVRPDRSWLGAWFPKLFGNTLIALLIGNWLLDVWMGSGLKGG